MRPLRRANGKRGLAALAGAMLLIWGCLQESRLYDIGPSHRPALHAVHGQRLAATMENINKNHRKAQRLPVRLSRERDFQDLARYAGRIAQLAGILSQCPCLGELDSEDRAVFERLAGRLGISAEALEAAAEDRDRPAAREAFARLTSTCNSCHSAFREEIAASTHGGW